eukprot:6222033-Karenia_brevis.AAC.1
MKRGMALDNKQFKALSAGMDTFGINRETLDNYANAKSLPGMAKNELDDVAAQLQIEDGVVPKIEDLEDDDNDAATVASKASTTQYAMMSSILDANMAKEKPSSSKEKPGSSKPKKVKSFVDMKDDLPEVEDVDQAVALAD